MDIVMSRAQLRAEGAHAAREGKPGHTNRYPAGTAAHKEWTYGFILAHRAAHARRELQGAAA